MSANVQDVLTAFDNLPVEQKHEAVVEILRRVSNATTSEPLDQTLIAAADELFTALDEAETINGQP